MMNLLFGTWRRRLITLGALLLSFGLSLTATLAVATLRRPETATAAQRIPGVGAVAVAIAESLREPVAEQGDEGPQDIETIRNLRPLSTEEVTSLIEALKQEREQCRARETHVDEEEKRLDVYRQTLRQERERLDSLRQEIAQMWDETKKARESLQRDVTELETNEAKNLKQLSSAYEKMKPERAAEIVAKLDEPLAAKTLYLMADRSAGKILENLDGETAARLTERMALLRKIN